MIGGYPRLTRRRCNRNTMINLRKGHPSHSLAPIQILQTAYQQYLASPAAAEGLAYGLDPGPPETQNAIANWLRKVYDLKDGPTGDNILITGGASTGLNNVLQKVTWPGPTRQIFMVAPTYYLAANIFRDCGYSKRITGIPEDDEGLDISALQEKIDILEKAEAVSRPGWQKWTYRYVFYGVPTFSNPTGSVMSLKRRTQLLEVARKYNMLLITDDVYDFLTYTKDPVPPRLVTLDASSLSSEGNIYGNTVSNCSFSKLLAPGLRFGFQEASKPLIHELSTHGATMSGGCPSQFTASTLTHLISSGTLDTRISTLKQIYSHRAKLYSEVMDKYWSPYGVKYTPCVGGYFFWVRLPEGVTSGQVAEEALCKGVWIMEGTSCMVPEDKSVEYKKFIRICVALEEEERAVEGIKILGEVFKKLLVTFRYQE